MPLTDLLRTKIHLVGLDGEVRVHDGSFELRTPSVPSFFHGTCLVLEDPPRSFGALHELHERIYGAGTRHRLVVWGGAPADPAVLRDAEAAGYRPSFGVSMVLTGPPDADERFDVRRLTTADRAASETLNRAADGSESEGGDASYREFKAGIRGVLRRWIEGGGITWWGAFDGGELIGQCGLARCDSAIGAGLGRFQAVEVHPTHRGKGVGSSLIATVARDAFERLGCARVVLEADADGPAVGLYERVGFRQTDDLHELLWSDGALVTRRELTADHAGVRAIVTAAFEQPDEAELVANLRGKPGVISMVAERDGQLLGHVLFSPVTVHEGPVTVQCGDGVWHAMALAPLAIRRQAQRTGVGKVLTRAGIAACREAGHEVCFVLGHPEYYPKFDFRPAPPLGLTCKWPVPDVAFQVLEIVPGALRGRSGRVVYDAAFDEL